MNTKQKQRTEIKSDLATRFNRIVNQWDDGLLYDSEVVGSLINALGDFEESLFRRELINETERRFTKN